MKCELCGSDLIIDSMLTKLGNEIEYSECTECGIIEVSH